MSAGERLREFWQRTVSRFRALWRPATPSVLDRQPAGTLPAGLGAPGEPPALARPRVLLINYDPTIQSAGGRRLTDLLGWHSADDLCRAFVGDLVECSGGTVEYEIVERITVDAWPQKADGFRYDETSFLRNWRSGGGWHTPDAVDYAAILSEFELLSRVESGRIDEVWLFAFPYAGFYESRMVGPGAFWCNSPPLARTEGISRRFVIMGFNYERGVGPMLESYGHRVESHLRHTWRRWQGNDNLWERFIRYDKIAPGQANCGWMHYAPNSVRDYDWGNTRNVRSNCDDWIHFPDLGGRTREVNCRDWGNGDMRAHHKWWFQHLPRAEGQTLGIANNWWRYAVDANAMQ